VHNARLCDFHAYISYTRNIVSVLHIFLSLLMVSSRCYACIFHVNYMRVVSIKDVVLDLSKRKTRHSGSEVKIND